MFPEIRIIPGTFGAGYPGFNGWQSVRKLAQHLRWHAPQLPQPLF